MSDIALIVQGDALRLPLADASVDLVVTSPPYAFLRAYDTGYPHLEVGAEATPAEFLEHLWQATAEMVRVLKPTGSIFVDLGDKYAGAPSGPRTLPHSRQGGEVSWFERPEVRRSVREKSLMLLPERYRIGCVDQLGLIARAVICWSKPNGLPESVTDRVRRSHEDFVHLTKQPRYYSAIDEIRESYSQAPDAVHHRRNGIAQTTEHPSGDHNSSLRGRDGRRDPYENPLGKLPGSVWSIASEPLRLPDHLGVQHYAAMPSEWPRRLILGWSPPGICLDCHQGRVPVVEINRVPHWKGGTNGGAGDGGGVGDGGHGKPRTNRADTILGYACACTPHTNHPERRGAGMWRPAIGDPNSSTAQGRGHDYAAAERAARRAEIGPVREYHLDGWKPPPTRPAVILDPFSGTGTTVMVARALGRIGIGVDLSLPYCRAARWRIHHDAGKAISRTWTERQGSLL